MSFGSLPSVLGNGGGVAISVIGGTGLFADGTAAAPSISFAADSDTGIYRVASGYTGISSNGSAAFSFGFNGADARINGIAGALIDFKSSGGINLIAGPANNNITLTPSGTGNVTIDTGVNTKLYLRESSTNGVEFQSSAGGCYISTVSTSPIIFRHSGSTETVRIFNNGRLGIGTGNTDSGALLQVGTNTTNAAGGMVFGTDTNFYRSAAGTLTIQGTTNTILQFAEGASASVRIQQASGSCYIDTQSAQPIILRTNNTTALTLDSSQRTILSGALRLNNAYVAGAVVGTGYVTIQDSTGTTYRVPVLV